MGLARDSGQIAWHNEQIGARGKAETALLDLHG